MEKRHPHRWHVTWMEVAHTIAKHNSPDPRLKVGAVLVSEDNTSMLALGYNGNAKNLPNEPESLEPGRSAFLHAELNCLIKAPYHYVLKKNLYVTHSPCRECSKIIINANVSRVIYDIDYRDLSGLELMKSVGIEVFKYSDLVQS